MHRISDEEIRHLLEEKGMTDSQAAEVLQVSRMSISRRRNKLGIKQKPKRPEGYYDLTDQQEVELKKLYAEGKNDYEVAKIMKFGRNRLRDWRNKNFIPSKTNKKGLGEKEYKEAKKLRDSGKTYEDIGKEIGVSRSSVSKFMAKKGHIDIERYRPKRPDWVDMYELTPFRNKFLLGICLGTESYIIHLLRLLITFLRNQTTKNFLFASNA